MFQPTEIDMCPEIEYFNNTLTIGFGTVDGELVSILSLVCPLEECGVWHQTFMSFDESVDIGDKDMALSLFATNVIGLKDLIEALINREHPGLGFSFRIVQG